MTTRAVSDYSVALDELRAGERTFRQAVLAKTRRKLSAAYRDYEQLGPVELHQATDLPTAIAYLHELQRLHQAHWTAKGKPGAFASRFFTEFHHAYLGRALRENLADFIAVARPSQTARGGRLPARSSATPRTAVDREQLAAIREWARANGHEVSDRGRISKAVRDAFAASPMICRARSVRSARFQSKKTRKVRAGAGATAGAGAGAGAAPKL